MDAVRMAVLVLAEVGTVGLGVWSFAHYLCAAVFAVSHGAVEPARSVPADSVTVLVPARNEGEGAVRVIRSLLLQDHPGPIRVLLLVRDASDTAIPLLTEAFGADLRDTRSFQRSVEIVYTGLDPKSAKINAVLPRIDSRWTAILDSDHQAHPNWLSAGIGRLHSSGAAMVQGSRAPLQATGFFALWDSLHQHVGCELYNAVFTRLGLPVFFTGTTALIDTALFQANPLRDCITEDVDLSYHLLSKGIRIVADPHGGSDEEVSPDMYSFLARRRRWANGHTEAFLRHAPAVLNAPLRPIEKLQFLFHGVHYLIAIPVFLLHLVIGLYFALLLSAPQISLAALVTALVAYGIAHSQRARDLGTRLSEALVAAVWWFPAVVMAESIAIALLTHRVADLALPMPPAIAGLGLLGLLAPLLLILVGMVGFAQAGLGSALAVLLSYPFAFYMDVTGVLLGLADFLLGRKLWHAVARHPAPAPSPTRLPSAIGIRDSWRAAPVLTLLRETVRDAMPEPRRPQTFIPLALVAGLAVLAVGGARLTRIPVADADCEALEHDADPWIVAPESIPGFCAPESADDRWTRRTSAFETVRVDDFQQIDASYWDRMDSTFYCNEAQFTPDNVSAGPDGLQIRLTGDARGDRAYSSGDLATKDSPDANYLYGRFETVMKPAKGSGVLSAFFLYRYDPWQEIDTEFLGQDTTRILLNVYYNPGQPGDKYNYGYRGTPVLVDLGFDASEDFHTYAVEWDVDQIRWFVDGKLVHYRDQGRPTPIPDLPMRLHMNLWPMCSEELAGPFAADSLPMQAGVKSVMISRRVDSPLQSILSVVDAPFVEHTGSAWQDDADWIRR